MARTLPTHPAQPLSLRFGRTTVTVGAGDVFSTPAEVMVVPANRRGVMAAGTAGQARLRGGVEIERELMLQAPLTLGTSVATTSGELAASGIAMILHAVVFDEPGGGTRVDIVERAIENVLASADRHRARSLVIPPIGTGVGERRISDDLAYATLVDAVAAHLRRYASRIDRISVACPETRDVRAVFGLVQEAHTLWWRMKTSSRET